MPSEQKGAYGGHLALSVRIHGEQARDYPPYVTPLSGSAELSTSGSGAPRAHVLAAYP